MITHFDSPLNIYLQASMGPKVSDLCNFLTIIEGGPPLYRKMVFSTRARLVEPEAM